MECPHCHGDIPRADLQDAIRQLLKDEYRDAKLVQLDIASGAAARLEEWLKRVAFFGGIPLTIALLIAGFFISKSTIDYETLHRMLDQQHDRVAQFDKNFAEAEKQLQERQAQLAKLPELEERVDQLERVNMKTGGNIDSATATKLANVIGNYQRYFRDVGFVFPPNSQSVSVEVSSGDNAGPPGSFAYYDPDTRTMHVAAKYASVDTVLREYTHRILYPSQLPAMPYEQQWLSYYFLESALASYFPVSFGNHPVFDGEHPEIAWDLRQQRPIRTTWTAAQKKDAGEAWGGAFWSLRNSAIGKADADRLLLRTWLAFHPAQPPAPADFVRALLAQDGGAHAEIITRIFRERGVAL